MSIEEFVHNLCEPPEVHSGYNVSVQWRDASGKWLVTITEPYRTESGEYELGPIKQYSYDPLAATTAYEAMMLGLSDKRIGL